jgi:hypothetical protein
MAVRLAWSAAAERARRRGRVGLSEEEDEDEREDFDAGAGPRTDGEACETASALLMHGPAATHSGYLLRPLYVFSEKTNYILRCPSSIILTLQYVYAAI